MDAWDKKKWERLFTCIRKLEQNVWFHFSTPCISETPVSGNISTIMLVRNLGSVTGVHLIQILTFGLHSNWFIIDIFRTICAKMLLFCKVMVFHTSVSSKSFCGLVLLSDILGNYIGEWVSVCLGCCLMWGQQKYQLQDGLPCPVPISLDTLHIWNWFGMFTTNTTVCHCSTCLCVFMSFKLCKGEDTGILFLAYLKTPNPCCAQSRNPFHHFLWCNIISKDRTHLIHESVPCMPLVSYMP